jgi:hypothetical protein
MKVDRNVVIIAALDDDTDEKEYWLSRTPQERLQHLETLRRINYGHLATARLQRVLEVVERQRG